MNKNLKILNKNIKKLTLHYYTLSNKVANNEYIGIINKWIYDNFYILEEENKSINLFFSNNFNKKMLNKYFDLHNILTNIFNECNYSLSPFNLCEKLKVFQKNNEYNFDYGKLQILTKLSILILINKIFDIVNIQTKEDFENNLSQKAFYEGTICNIFNSIKELRFFDSQKLIENVSLSESKLNTFEEYKNADDKTKAFYREHIILLNKNDTNENEFIEKLIKKTKENNTLLGNELNLSNFGKNEKFYIFINLFFSAIITFFITLFFTNYKILFFALLFLPVFFVFKEFVNFVYEKKSNINFLPRLDLSNGIKDDMQTMVIIPTIISDTNKIDEMFEKLERFCILNKNQKNLYFALVGDIKESQFEKLEIDNKIVEYGKEKCKILNEKYDNKFYFCYRNRIFNSKQNCYMGYERKRGAILNFNSLLLNELSKEEISKYFLFENVSINKKEIKYVLTLDCDNEIRVDTISKLLGTIAHPLNKSKIEGNKINGYSIIEPCIENNIYNQNTSKYSKLFSKISKNSYSNEDKNFYFSTFQKANFMGKGIYELKTYQSILKNKFPDNMILSHDLLEGEVLNCGFCQDASILDNSPNTFIADTKRHSRWTRGDFQLLPFLKSTITNRQKKKEKNTLSSISKWKILENIFRYFLPVSALITFILGFTFVKLNLIEYIIITVLFLFASKGILNLFLSPFYAIQNLTSFVLAMTRLITKKHLLDWVTSEQIEKKKDKFISYIKIFLPTNLLLSLCLLLSIFCDNQLGLYSFIVLLIVNIILPIILYKFSTTTCEKTKPITLENKDYLNTLAKSTWKFFEDELNEQNNFLIPDNFQYDREFESDYKTSSTNIGFSLIAVISAFKLNFIEKDKAISLLENILKTIENLPKWNGHLYNWYNIKTFEILYPRFVSSVDSGNLVASLITLKNFLKEFDKEDLEKKIDNLIKNSDFSYFFTDSGLLSLGYNGIEKRLVTNKYDIFVSESRLTSYLAISKGDIPYSNWNGLDKAVTKYKNKYGITSWTGSMFEFFMPQIFVKNYPNTLISQSLKFNIYCHKKYMKSINKSLPWGISECAFDDLNDAINYLYSPFYMPYQRLKKEESKKLAISPYSSLMALSYDSNSVIKNIKNFEKINMIGKYGLFESFDLSTNKPVYAYFSHHQGMILSALCNYLKDNCIQKYFESENYIKAFFTLNLEKPKYFADIDYNFKKPIKQNKNTTKNNISKTFEVEKFEEIKEDYTILSNSRYSTIIDTFGQGYSSFKDYQINRYRKINDEPFGIFFYLKDNKNEKIWSNTALPMKKFDHYKIEFSNEKANIELVYNKVKILTEILILNKQVEIRKLTITNLSDTQKDLSLCSYLEPILTENINDMVHRTFNSMFITCDFDKETSSLIMKKTLRNNPSNLYLLNNLVCENEQIDEFETRKKNFVGNKDLSYPENAFENFSKSLATPLDPIMSLKTNIKIDAKMSKTIALYSVFGTSKNNVINIFKETKNNFSQFLQTQNKYLLNMQNVFNFSLKEINDYNNITKFLFSTKYKILESERIKNLEKNTLSQNALWRFGISGDNPIICYEFNNQEDTINLNQIIKSYSYFKLKNICIDYILINNFKTEYNQILQKTIDTEVDKLYSNEDFVKSNGQIRVVHFGDLKNEEKTFLKAISYLYLSFNIDFHKKIEELNNYEAIKKENIENQQSQEIEFDKNNIELFNGYGGFLSNGKEYIILNNNTPLPWVNVIANEKFGTLVTNNFGGFTYAFNSNEYKLTSWTNNISTSYQSEGIIFNGKNILPKITIFGFGYVKFLSKFDNISQEITQFVSSKDSVKITILKLTNETNQNKDISLKYWLNLVLAKIEEKSNRYLTFDFDKDKNQIIVNNKFENSNSKYYVGITSSEKIQNFDHSNNTHKSLNFDLSLLPKETKEISFVLTCDLKENIDDLLSNYSNISKCKNELELVKQFWKNKLEKLQIKTNDKSFDYVLNGWYLYQTICSRIMAKAGYYQISGAYGFRDQLQDSMNICMIEPSLTKNQIIENTRHQFCQGDVLHWWLKDKNFGLRSTYKDDALWLISATFEYLKTTNDTKFLDTIIPFIDGPELLENQSENCFEFSYSQKETTLFNHLQLLLNNSMKDLGVHHLSKMGGGDWNDGMNKIGVRGKGESLWLSMFLYENIFKFISICEKTNKSIDRDYYINFAKELKANINENGFENDYYLRAYMDNGDKIGSYNNTECKIDLLCQSFAILSDIANEKQKNQVLNKVDEMLYDKEHKIVKLLTPAFQNSKNYPGYIMDYPEGIRENGGQYTHSVAWYIMALLKANKFEEGYKIYQEINPINRTKNIEEISKYKVEPYVICADIYSNKGNEGRGGWTWYTGSAGWFYRVGIQEILGIQIIDENKLVVKPKMQFETFSFSLKYKDTTYLVEVIKKDKYKIFENNEELKEIILQDDKKIHNIKIEIQ